jgi:hypothetical protein
VPPIIDPTLVIGGGQLGVLVYIAYAMGDVRSDVDGLQKQIKRLRGRVRHVEREEDYRHD